MPSATWSAHSEPVRDKLELYQLLSDSDPPYGGKWHARASVGVVDIRACSHVFVPNARPGPGYLRLLVRGPPLILENPRVKSYYTLGEPSFNPREYHALIHSH